jgi:hypothetical protein
MRGMDRFLIVKSREEQLQQVFANGRKGSLRRKVRSVDMVDAATAVVGLQDGIGDFSQVLIHVC